MDDSISRQAALDVLDDFQSNIELGIDDYAEKRKALCDLPSADRPRGEWVQDTYGWVYCSHCKKYLDDYQMVFFLKPFDYCPNCGAVMGGKDNE